MSRPASNNEPVKVHPFTNVNTGENECDWCTKPDWHANHAVDGLSGNQALLTGMILGAIMGINDRTGLGTIVDVRPMQDDLGNYTNTIWIQTRSGDQFRVIVDRHDETDVPF